MLESKQAVDIAHGQALVDEFGDYEAVYQEIIRLKREVDKGDMIIGKLLNEGKAAISLAEVYGGTSRKGGRDSGGIEGEDS